MFWKGVFQKVEIISRKPYSQSNIYQKKPTRKIKSALSFNCNEDSFTDNDIAKNNIKSESQLQELPDQSTREFERPPSNKKDVKFADHKIGDGQRRMSRCRSESVDYTLNKFSEMHLHFKGKTASLFVSKFQ